MRAVYDVPALMRAQPDFLAIPDPRFVRERFARSPPCWRPFASGELSAESQRYAIRVLRGAFAWLVDRCYLAGTPWTAANDPPVIQRASAVQIEHALRAVLWRRLRDELDVRRIEENAVLWRAVRATILLMGDSGLRREAAASARRENLKASLYGTLERPVWELTIAGKRQRERTVPVSVANARGVARALGGSGHRFRCSGRRRGQGHRALHPVGRYSRRSSLRGPRRHVGGIDRGGKAATPAGRKRILAFQPE